MEKSGKKTRRSIKFYSEKNHRMVTVHTPQARDYTRYLEEQSWVESYETSYQIESKSLRERVNPVGIRSSYFQTDWVSNFYVKYADGRTGIRELVTQDGLYKQAVVEQLELSRRYWVATDVSDWQIVIVQGGVELS